MSRSITEFKMSYKNIIWDYNGTIVDDAKLAVDAENMVLASYGKAPITLDFYLDECEMPILNFYNKIFEMKNYDFAEISERFMQSYELLFPQAEVFPEVRQMLAYIDGKGLNQAVISGFEGSRLRKSLNSFGLYGYFDFVSGSDDIGCGDKSERAFQMLKKHKLNPKETLFIGDMYHDYETAKYVGADCVLIAKGHQGARVLKSYGITVLENALQLKNIL